MGETGTELTHTHTDVRVDTRDAGLRPSETDTDSGHSLASKHCLSAECVVVCWLLNVPATCLCISGTDLLRQVYVLPH